MGICRSAALETAFRIVELNSPVEAKRHENIAFTINRDVLNIPKRELDRLQGVAAPSPGHPGPAEEAECSANEQNCACPNT